MLTSDTALSPVMERAEKAISDTYFLEWQGVDGSMDALRNRIAWYQRLLDETQAFALTLTEDERALLQPPPRELISGSTGRETKGWGG